MCNCQYSYILSVNCIATYIVADIQLYQFSMASLAKYVVYIIILMCTVHVQCFPYDPIN